MYHVDKMDKVKVKRVIKPQLITDKVKRVIKPQIIRDTVKGLMVAVAVTIVNTRVSLNI